MKFRATIPLLLLTVAASSLGAETLTRGNKLSVDASKNGQLVMDVAGELWLLPLAGGEAVRIAQGRPAARRPRWSPDAMRLVYAASASTHRGIWVHDLESSETQRVGDGTTLDLHPAWHPDGERIVFSSDRRGTGFDLWEVDLQTGLQWRLSDHPGDETEPAWSADGRDLVYVYRDEGRWSLILRPHGGAEEVLVSSPTRLSGPSWRPDDSLIMYWQDSDEGIALNMIILSAPRLVRRYADGEEFVGAPVSWLDRHRMFYTAGGKIRQRLFNAWSSRTVQFRATLEAEPEAVGERVRRNLPRIDEPGGRLVVHAARLFDGLRGTYLRDRDIIIDKGRISGVEAHADRPGTIVIDMGDLAVLPGYVDVQARLPEGADEATGPLLLAAGVTTLVADHDEAEHLNRVWSGREVPGPRLLPAGDWPVGDYSAFADSQTPGLDAVLGSRPARLIGFGDAVARRFSEPPVIDAGVSTAVLGSLGNGMPAGIALHAELRALVAAGLRPEYALRAAGVNAAAELGVDPRLGRIATGAVADLVFVEGNPLSDIGDALRVVAVVRNGRFFSVAGLIERAATARDVE
jgi:hypothetical protein